MHAVDLDCAPALLLLLFVSSSSLFHPVTVQTTNEAITEEARGGLSGGAIAGIIIGVIVLIVLVVLLVVIILRNRKHSQLRL